VTPAEALAFVCAHGLALECGTGPVPSLAAVIAGEPIRGSWWAHARGREIFAVTRAIRDSPDVLVCRLVGGKITYVHRRLAGKWSTCFRWSSRALAAVRANASLSTGRPPPELTRFDDRDALKLADCEEVLVHGDQDRRTASEGSAKNWYVYRIAAYIRW
jgi:hypothetical protein